MPRRVTVDAGPLVALFDRGDEHHGRAVSFLKSFKGELISNLAVLTEVTYLLDFSAKAQLDFLRWVTQGAVTLIEVTRDDLARVLELIEDYADLPADFADATLVAICERLGIVEVASADRHFAVYRLNGKKPLKNVFLTH